MRERKREKHAAKNRVGTGTAATVHTHCCCCMLPTRRDVTLKQTVIVTKKEESGSGIITSCMWRLCGEKHYMHH